jgi:RND family efflux transporter MFP subunit
MNPPSGIRSLIFLLGIGLSVAGCSKELDSKFTQVPKPKTDAEILAAKNALDTIETEVLVAVPQEWPVIVRSQGSLEADQISTVATEVDGQIVGLLVDIGDKVNAGDVLARIDPADYELVIQQSTAKLFQAKSAIGLKAGDTVDSLDPLNAPPSREAKAVWDEAKQQVARIRQLYEQKAIADVDLDAAEAAERVAEARYASALNGVREKIAVIQLQKAELEIAKQQLSRTSIIAPISGRIQSRNVALGNFVSPGEALFTIAVTDLLRYRSSVPEKYAQSLALGQEVKVLAMGRLKPRTTRVERIAPTLDQQSRSLYFEALVKNDDEQIRPGLFAESEITLDAHRRAIVLPNTALVRFAGTDKVWKVIDGVAQEVVVRVGRRTEDFSEVLDGVNDQDIVLKDAARGRIAKVRIKEDVKAVSNQDTAPTQPSKNSDSKNDTTRLVQPMTMASIA